MVYLWFALVVVSYNHDHLLYLCAFFMPLSACNNFSIIQDSSFKLSLSQHCFKHQLMSSADLCYHKILCIYLYCSLYCNVSKSLYVSFFPLLHLKLPNEKSYIIESYIFKILSPIVWLSWEDYKQFVQVPWN